MKKYLILWILAIMVSLVLCHILFPLTHVIADDNEEVGKTLDDPDQPTKSDEDDSGENHNDSNEMDDTTNTTDNDNYEDESHEDLNETGDEEDEVGTGSHDDGNQNDEINDDVGEEQEEYEKRTIEIKNTSTSVDLKSDWERDNLEDEFKLRFVIDGAPQLIIEYNTERNSSKTELKYIIVLEKIKEYNDTNHNGRYDRNDTILSNYSFEKSTFKSITHTVEKTVENETIHRVSTGTTDGVFSIILHVVGNFTKIASQLITPTEVKIDFIINYHYTSNESMIALKATITSKNQTEITSSSMSNDEDDESNVKIISGNHTGFFSWADHAVVDNVSRPVNVTIIQIEGSQSENKDIIYFCYPHGKHIVHDPKVGVISLSSLTFIPSQSTLSPMDSVLIYAVVFIAVSLIVVGSIYLRKRM